MEDNTVRQLHLPSAQIEEMLEMDNSGDQRWLSWLEECYKKLQQRQEDSHCIEIARQAMLRDRLSNRPSYVQNIDEIDIEDLLP